MLPKSEGGDSFALSVRDLFGIPIALTLVDASSMLSGLEHLFKAQLDGLRAVRQLPSVRSSDEAAADSGPSVRPPDRRQLVADLELLRAWFDPTAKGERVREAVSAVPVVRTKLPFDGPPIVKHAGNDRRIVTPEGRVLISCLRGALTERIGVGVPGEIDPDATWITLREEDIVACILVLLQTYRVWTRRRLDDVVGLLTSETSTLRPAAAGLLLTLLINRNTDANRALPRPKDPRILQIISEAIAGPAAAYAKALAGSDRTDSRSLDLYRGWPLGELRRRLGPSLHSDLGSGIYLDSQAVNDAISRLVDDIRRRPSRLRERVPAALAATLREYESRRPELAGLGLAFENPAETRRLLDVLRQAAVGSSQNRPNGIGAAELGSELGPGFENE
jgi:hypothetical protein